MVSVRTVEHHVENIYRKLDLRTRVEAAAFAVQHGVTTEAGV